MPYKINFAEPFKEWWDTLERDLKKALLKQIGFLEHYGPHLSRPYADTLHDTTIANLKELRLKYQNQPYRIIYAFDPKREALLLIGGNKASSKRWYKQMIPKAEAIFNAHLQALREEQDNHD